MLTSSMLGIALVIFVSGVIFYYYIWQVRKPSEPEPESESETEEVWCLVGENTLGRWCVQAPYKSSCSPLNRYGSREACEMVDASSLPLGVTHLNGAVMSPFMQPRASLANTF
jgi:hypothetical protein